MIRKLYLPKYSTKKISLFCHCLPSGNGKRYVSDRIWRSNAISVSRLYNKERLMKIRAQSFGGALLELLFSFLITITEPHCEHLINLSGLLCLAAFTVFL